jgi:hypothetical protein
MKARIRNVMTSSAEQHRQGRVTRYIKIHTAMTVQRSLQTAVIKRRFSNPCDLPTGYL